MFLISANKRFHSFIHSFSLFSSIYRKQIDLRYRSSVCVCVCVCLCLCLCVCVCVCVPERPSHAELVQLTCDGEGTMLTFRHYRNLAAAVLNEAKWLLAPTPSFYYFIKLYIYIFIYLYIY